MSLPLTFFLACILPITGLVLLVGGIFYLRSEVDVPGLDLAEWIKPLNRSTEGQPSTSRFPAGSIGDISSQIGHDIRELLMAGFTRAEIASYSNEEIDGVMDGRLTLAELREQSGGE